MSLIQTDALNFPLEEVKVARMVFTAAEAVAADADALMALRAATAPCHATLVASTHDGADTLTINFPATLGTTPIGKVSFVLDAASDDTLAVSGVEATGVITIKLASQTATNNTAALITTAINGLTPTGEGGVEGKINGIDISGVVCVAGGAWDTSAVAEGADMDDVACTGGGGETVIPDTDVLFHQPPCARNITATAGGAKATDIAAVAVTVYGTNINDEPISETLPAFTANTAETKAGTKAFKTITSVFLPSHDGTGASVSLGYGDILGIPFMFSKKPYLRVTQGGVIKTAPTIAVDVDKMEKNTVDPYDALDGTEVGLYFILPEA